MDKEEGAETKSIMPAYNRRGEKIGWVGGWTGGFLWIAILAAIRFFQGDIPGGTLGMIMFLVAEALIVLLAPWRFPATRYIKLMLPIYGLFLLSSCWAVWTLSGFDQPGFSYWTLFMILPVLSPLITIGGKRWQDGAPRNG